MILVIHHNDADGRCAAAIVNHWMNTQKNKEHISFVEMSYENEVPLDRIHRDDQVVIVDFSFKPPDMAKIMSATDKDVIWIDHHRTAECYNYNLKGKRDFTDKGMSGAELTWYYFFPELAIPRGVLLLGDYDSWRLNDAPVCFQFYEGLKLRYTAPTSIIWEDLFSDVNGTTLATIIHEGLTAIKYRDSYCDEMRNAFGYATAIDGTKAYACNLYKFGSKAFGAAFDTYPICIAYVYNGEQFIVSLYSQTIDVSEIAKKFGGGGHKGAAGFVCSTLPFTKDR